MSLRSSSSFDSDISYVNRTLRGKISGPWRLTVWSKTDSPPSYVFSEEHANKGLCPEEKCIISLAKDILQNTENVHVFVEHFIHANEVENVKDSVATACSSKRDAAILNNMRTCLEVIRVRESSKQERIHFIDPRADIVAILPDGKIYDAIDSYVKLLVQSGDKKNAIMTLYEAFIHPLLSLFPDKKVMKGRLTGNMEQSRELMKRHQQEFFDKIWRDDVIYRIFQLTELFREIEKNSDLSRVRELQDSYRDMTNKFLDTWLLVNVFLAENDGMSASVIYLGSLHSMNFETYLEGLGYKSEAKFENRDLTSCLAVDI